MTTLFSAVKKYFRPTPQGCSLAMEAPQGIVAVQFRAGTRTLDVTEFCAVAALKPLVLRIEATIELQSISESKAWAWLRLMDREQNRLIGQLRLRFLKECQAAGVSMYLYEVTDGTHFCLSRLRRAWDSFLYRRTASKKAPESSIMTPSSVEHIMIFYSCPRPVYFVSVDDGQHSNLFPMDLMGPMSSNHFTLALRNTSPSVETMKIARRVALGDVPASAISIAYQLGTHHKMKQTDWKALPFDAVPSNIFGLRVPAIALRIRELELLGFIEVGSHTLFTGRICSDSPRMRGPQLFHSSGAYQAFRARQGRAFATLQSTTNS